MKIEITTTQMLKVLYVLAWIIFVGVCIEAGGFMFNAIYTFFLNSIDAKYFWKEVDLSALYKYDPGYFLVIISIMIIVAVMRAVLFYLIIKILHDKKLNMAPKD